MAPEIRRRKGLEFNPLTTEQMALLRKCDEFVAVDPFADPDLGLRVNFINTAQVVNLRREMGQETILCTKVEAIAGEGKGYLCRKLVKPFHQTFLGKDTAIDDWDSTTPALRETGKITTPPGNPYSDEELQANYDAVEANVINKLQIGEDVIVEVPSGTGAWVDQDWFEFRKFGAYLRMGIISKLNQKTLGKLVMQNIYIIGGPRQEPWKYFRQGMKDVGDDIDAGNEVLETFKVVDPNDIDAGSELKPIDTIEQLRIYQMGGSLEQMGSYETRIYDLAQKIRLDGGESLPTLLPRLPDQLQADIEEIAPIIGVPIPKFNFKTQLRLMTAAIYKNTSTINPHSFRGVLPLTYSAIVLNNDPSRFSDPERVAHFIHHLKIKHNLAA